MAELLVVPELATDRPAVRILQQGAAGPAEVDLVAETPVRRNDEARARQRGDLLIGGIAQAGKAPLLGRCRGRSADGKSEARQSNAPKLMPLHAGAPVFCWMDHTGAPSGSPMQFGIGG